ncbi:TIGR02281 family clan AA aspartic protease [Exilibacterium tricleocarpae]|uniref:TIGR02281 family clan AA aspartic protease n=1 Tax=Exilibacterium tricleocarpae TaxID=2591008 RepID=A0A545TQS5_9GAMM|nr:TIGR02281 family clan AA aspartic protease [Exilibacterium tricleocarpae]TQV79471.1 TIGR02281 family clan AA aspartic protease [Exilibacterium tricleocarpae]
MQDNHPQRETPAGKSMGKGMLIVAWVIALGLLTTFFAGWEGRQYNPNTNIQGQVQSNVREVVLESNRQHHYVATGLINGEEVVFLLDTGASDVVVPAQLAGKLGLKRGNAGYAQTANGIVQVFRTQLDTLDLGVIHLKDVRASINPGMSGNEVLLGMSALRHVEFTQRGTRLTLRQYGP